MKSGPNMAQVEILRRAADADGNPTGDFGVASTVWGRWTQSPGALAAVGGQREDAVDLLLSVNDSAFTRTVTNADRARIKGVDYTITSAGLPERKSGTIQLVLKRGINA